MKCWWLLAVHICCSFIFHDWLRNLFKQPTPGPLLETNKQQAQLFKHMLLLRQSPSTSRRYQDSSMAQTRWYQPLTLRVDGTKQVRFFCEPLTWSSQNVSSPGTREVRPGPFFALDSSTPRLLDSSTRSPGHPSPVRSAAAPPAAARSSGAELVGQALASGRSWAAAAPVRVNYNISPT